MSRPTFAYLPSSHLDLFWLGNYKTCLERGAEIIRQYVERCMAASDETFLVDTVVFAEYFLQRHPELRSAFLQLVREGRFEIGSAYVDRWETLILGESLIRNVQLGKQWCRQVLNIENPVATHPDLPSMTPQIAQIYAQAGLRYYVTSRKVLSAWPGLALPVTRWEHDVGVELSPSLRVCLDERKRRSRRRQAIVGPAARYRNHIAGLPFGHGPASQAVQATWQTARILSIAMAATWKNMWHCTGKSTPSSTLPTRRLAASWRPMRIMPPCPV